MCIRDSISLNVSIGKVLVTECAGDAYELHPRLGGVRLDSTDAQEEGTVVDVLLTGDGAAFSAAEQSAIWSRYNKTKKRVDEVCYSDWNGLRVIDADNFQNYCARECAADARAKGLTPVLQSDLEEASAEAQTLRTKLELAGINLRAGKRQVPIYWVEFADDEDHTPVQCRGKLDQLDGWVIRDLKKVASLQNGRLSRACYDYGWDIQLAAYRRGVEQITGEYGRYRCEWAFVRTGKLPSARKVTPDVYRMELGERRWRLAVNKWSACMKAGLFPGYELDPLSLTVEPWMAERVGELEVAAFENEGS